MQIPYLDLTIQYQALEPQLNERIQKVLKAGQYVLGPEVEECEQRLAEFTGAPYCVTAASGTDAWLMALLAHDVGPGDEIIMPSFSFFATAEVVALIGAIPVFVDIDPRTFNMDVSQIEAKITSKTKGIAPVSLYGQVADMDEIQKIADRHNLPVMEDAAQSFGARYNGKTSCNLSTFGCTSFFPAKPLGCFGDGGAVFCQSEEHYEILKQIRVHGQSGRYHHTRMGFNCRMDTIQCAVILAKLDRYPWEIEQRQRIASTYNQEFQGLENLITPLIKEDRDSVFAQYTLRVKNRDHFQKSLSELGVPTSIHYPKGMHEQPALAAFRPATPLTVCESVCDEVISLPLYADMPEAHVAYVVESVKKVMARPEHQQVMDNRSQI
jgi:UDP-2-acetamido-2-deoxy-ribo-hexuluronate aminotransferase